MTPLFYRLFLDDERLPKNVTWIALPPGPWTVVRSYEEFVKTVETKGVPGFVSFDHDLADCHYKQMNARILGKKEEPCTEKTGADCARWLAQHCLDNDITIPEFTVHSMNIVGVENIKSILNSALRVQAK